MGPREYHSAQSSRWFDATPARTHPADARLLEASDRGNEVRHYASVFACGSAFHLGSNRSAASKTEPARRVKTPSQPQVFWKKPGIVPPRIAPTDPQPLTRPEAVEAPFLVPKSTAAVPLTRESGA